MIVIAIATDTPVQNADGRRARESATFSAQQHTHFAVDTVVVERETASIIDR